MGRRGAGRATADESDLCALDRVRQGRRRAAADGVAFRSLSAVLWHPEPYLWIHRDDWVAMVTWALTAADRGRAQLTSPIRHTRNSPRPLTGAAATRAAAVPRGAAVAVGDMAGEIVTASGTSEKPAAGFVSLPELEARSRDYDASSDRAPAPAGGRVRVRAGRAKPSLRSRGIRRTLVRRGPAMVRDVTPATVPRTARADIGRALKIGCGWVAPTGPAATPAAPS